MAFFGDHTLFKGGFNGISIARLHYFIDMDRMHSNGGMKIGISSGRVLLKNTFFVSILMDHNP